MVHFCMGFAWSIETEDSTTWASISEIKVYKKEQGYPFLSNIQFVA